MSTLVYWECHFPQNMAFQGPDCKVEGWDPNQSFKKHTADLISLVKEDSLSAEAIQEMHDRLSFVENGESGEGFQLWAMELIESQKDGRNMLRAHRNNPLNVILDWLQNVLPKDMLGGNWGMNGFLVDEYNETSCYSCLILDDGTLQDSYLKGKSPPTEKSDNPFGGSSANQCAIGYTAKGEIRKWITPEHDLKKTLDPDEKDPV